MADDICPLTSAMCVRRLFPRLFHSASKPAAGEGGGHRRPDAAFLRLLQEPEQRVLRPRQVGRPPARPPGLVLITEMSFIALGSWFIAATFTSSQSRKWLLCVFIYFAVCVGSFQCFLSNFYRFVNCLWARFVLAHVEFCSHWKLRRSYRTVFIQFWGSVINPI